LTEEGRKKAGKILKRILGRKTEREGKGVSRGGHYVGEQQLFIQLTIGGQPRVRREVVWGSRNQEKGLVVGEAKSRNEIK